MTSLRQPGLLALLIVALAGCEGSGVATVEPTQDQPVSAKVQGRATKGPLDGARIELLATDSRGRPQGLPVAVAITDAAGNWEATVPADHTGLLVRSVGGRFVDESDPNTDAPRTVQLGAQDALLSYLPAGESVASITLFSDALVRKAQLEADGPNFAQRLDSNRGQYTSALGLDPLITTAADPLAPVGNDEQRRYALIAGGLAYALNALAIERGLVHADFATIDLLLEDLIDCRLDGIGLGGQALYDFAALNGRTLNDEILRFRNNHFDQYADLGAPVVSAAGCEPTPGTTDTVAPVFSNRAAPLTLAADDATGSDPTGLLDAGADFVAIDDRDVTPRIDVRLPSRLPLGVNRIEVVAIDGWGNETLALWEITVTDQTPPQIVPPPDTTADALDVRTPVALGTAIASDNVSLPNGIQISNDAPADGFVVGDTRVIWTAVDAAGLSAQAVQIVTVIGATPVLANAIVPPLGAVGSDVDLDLSIYFNDPFAASLIFALTGLPEGTGLIFDPLTGQLSGAPSDADFAASPLALQISASNGQFSIDASFELEIAPRDPDFSLNVSTLTLDEDFANAPAIISSLDSAAPAGATEFSVTVVDPVVTASVNAQGLVAVTAVPDAFGATTLMVTATNVINDRTITREVAVIVQPVNDPPQALTATQSLRALADTPFSLALTAQFIDVDDPTLSFNADNLPRSLTLSPDGLINGMPTEVEARAGVFRVNVSATDAAGELAIADIALQIDVLDSDGDGISDARETELGTNPVAIDTDGDGIDDATEILAGADPTIEAAQVIYLSTDGDNANDGQTPATARRDLSGLTDLQPGISSAQPTFVVIAADETERYSGMKWLMPPCDHIVFAGSVDSSGRVRLGDDGQPTTTLTAQDSPSLEIDGCNNVQVQNITVADNTRHAVATQDSNVRFSNIRLRNNRALLAGGALRIENGQAQLRDVVFAGNVSDQHGGALAVVGESGSLSVAQVSAFGNRASEDGGAFYLANPGLTATLDNVLLVGNGATRGAAMYGESVSQWTVTNATITLNQARQAGQGAPLDTNSGNAIDVTDSLIVGNVDGVGTPSGLPDGIGSSFNSMDRGPIGISDVALQVGVEAFGEQYFATAAAQSIDQGSRTALAAGLDDRFAEAGSQFADQGIVDRGYHYVGRPSDVAFDAATLRAGLTVVQGVRAAVVGYATLDVVPRVNGVGLGAGHRVALAPLNGRSNLTNVVRVFDSSVTRDVLATDLGDGRYRLYVDLRSAGATEFTLTVDDVVADRSVQLVCALGGCDSTDGLADTP
ncbi:MAG: thrombospondin type 3 repeat-containing protein [Gammaproteobacteria bacterium]